MNKFKFNSLLKHPGYNFGGGGGGTTTSTTYTSNLPEYAKPYFEDIMGRAQGASLSPYQAYGGDRVAGFTPYQTSAHQMTKDIATGGTPAGLQAGQQMTTNAANYMSGYNYNPLKGHDLDASNAAHVQQFMSPYMQQVVDVEKQAAAREYQMADQIRQQKAARAGAFGGSRQAVESAEAQRNLMSQLQGIQSKGSQAAYEQAMQALQTQRAGSEASRQFGATSGLQAAQHLGALGQQLGSMGEAEQKLALERAQALSGVGKEQQAQEQQKLDQKYAEFAAQRDYEQNMINWYNSILRGVPVSMNQSVYQTTPAPSTASQIAGLGIAGLGAYNALK